ncbi:macrophage mannose receptor 1-like [Amphiprion ocellaris]|uniref:macrophage mannose receptor 1-like n=1 Tax=Amphiprion ocellaris TaxID=80972 RepID=UPI00241143AE|nr:macrophage mannose receptor 1-like [Amphiprion ocellaris]
MNWTNAQNYCREKYTDLASIESTNHIKRLTTPYLDTEIAWIGLRDDPDAWKSNMGNSINSWRWSVTREPSTTGYQNWVFANPNNLFSAEYCVIMDIAGAWLDTRCGFLKFFVCYNETAESEKTYVLIRYLRTWNDAQTYCRQHYKDLPIIESAEDNANVQAVKPLVDAWIGLYREAWTWSNNQSSSFRNWQFREPDNAFLNEYCVAEDYQHNWRDTDCQRKIAFICHKDPVVDMTVVGMKIETDADMTDPAINNQILQHLTQVLRKSKIVPRKEPVDIKLRWKMEPRKQKVNELKTPLGTFHM